MRNSFYTGLKKGGLVLTITMFVLGISNPLTAQIQEVKRLAPPMEQLPQEQNQLAVSYEDEIKEDELPESVATSIKENYTGFELAEIYRGSDGSYKVKLGKESDKMAVFYNAGGEFMRVENDIEKDDETINDDWR